MYFFWTLRSFLFIAIAIFSTTIVQSVATEEWITGKVTHSGSANIDENVQVEISLRDVSLMDVASKLIASTTISNPKTFPISYKLQYNPSEIKAGLTYALSARITDPGDKLLYINDVQIQVPLIETSSANVDIAVIRIGRSSNDG